MYIGKDRFSHNNKILDDICANNNIAEISPLSSS